MIIVEGPNKCGKSTLAQEIRKEQGLRPVYIRSYKTKSRVWMTSMAQVTAGIDTIIDRCWITEMIYHKKPRLRLDQLMYLSLLTFGNARDVLILLPPMEELKRRGLDPNEKPEGASFPAHMIYKRYKALLNKRLRVTTSDNYTVYLHKYLGRGILVDKKKLYTSKRLYGVGTLEPEVLFLADKVNPRVSKKMSVPPLVPVDRTSTGSFFLNMIHHSGIDIGKIHVHNSMTPSGKYYSKHLVGILKPKIIIAMGDVAHEAARVHFKCKAKVGKIPHPAKLNRFEANTEKYYGRELENVIKELGGSAKLFK